ncbi:unnamed protein product [Calypogeia fissa]
MVSLQVPIEMRIAIAQLYQKVLIRFSTDSSEEVLSTLGVIQGCPLSPTLFGIFIDQLHDVLKELGSAGAQLGTLAIQLLMFADDVVLLAHTQSGLQQHLIALEHFCKQSGMQVNMKKTKCLTIGTRQEISLYFAGDKVETVTCYKYLGVEFSQSLSWAACVKHRVAHGYKAFYSMIHKCKAASLSTWTLKKHLFTSLVKPVILYGVQVWGPATSKSCWILVEAIQKLFLEMELGVRSQTPYTLFLAEAGLLPLEAEALHLTLQYAMRVEALKESRLPKQAFHTSRSSGWYAYVCRWAQAWDLSEQDWHIDPKKLRTLLHGKAVRKLWRDPSPRLQYYMRDVSPNPVVLYEEKEYLRAPISIKLRQMIARYRLSSHHLAVEEGRWKGVKRQDRVCTLCDSGSIENEYHVFIACRWYQELRVAHQILVTDLHDLFKLPPKQLGLFIMAVDKKRCENIRH